MLGILRLWPLGLLLGAFLLGCGGAEREREKPAAGTSSTLGSSAALDIETLIAAELGADIRLVSAEGRRPGVSNPVEASITLRNVSAADRKVLVTGEWRAAGGATRGGGSSVRELGAGEEATFTVATRSTDVRSYRVSVAGTGMSASELQGAAIAAAATGAVEGYGIAYTPTPSLDQIPAWSPRGAANGEFFEAKSLLFYPFESRWIMQIHDREVDPLQSVAIVRDSHPDLQSVNINLPSEPFAGAVFERELAYGGGHFQIKPSADAMTTTSWNTSIAWVIEITDWERKPWQEGGWVFQQAGTASGRLYICFQGSELSLANSFVAGEFVDAPIVYYGRPR